MSSSQLTMREESVISIEQVSKAYRIWNDPSDRLKHLCLAEAAKLLPGRLRRSLECKAKSYYRDFYALDGVSFDVRPGEAVGIIGRNGAGKSTLLQIIAGTLRPTAGTSRVDGRITALLELGAGFNPEFTGRENVELSCSILGLSKSETEQKFDDIVEFAEIGDFIEEPVKTYSSGMMLRLAFAVNTSVDPEILIIDEALSVGDAPFAAKCFRRLRNMIESGVAVLFVSHDIGTVRSICSRALWLKDGRAEMWGDAKSVAKEYEKFCWAEQGVVMGSQSAPSVNFNKDQPVIELPEVKHDSHILESLKLSSFPDLATDRFGTQKVFFRKVALLNKEKRLQKEFDFDETASLFFQLEASRDYSGMARIGCRVKSVKQDFVFSVSDLESSLELNVKAGETKLVSYDFPLPIAEGRYTFLVALFAVTPESTSDNIAYDFSNSEIFDSLDQICPFTVRAHPPIPAVGPVHLNREMILHKAEP